MADFIRPAASESDFDYDSDMEWGMSDPFEPTPVHLHPVDPLIPHLFPWVPAASPEEARCFWMDGGWDDAG